jgi:hypothetical protein
MSKKGLAFSVLFTLFFSLLMKATINLQALNP